MSEHNRAASAGAGTGRPRVAVFAGPNATILNSEPLVTSNKARQRAGLPLRTNPDGTPLRFDVLRPQRLGARATVYVEQFSAHPLEADATHLYAPPDGYVDRDGAFHRERTSPDDIPVYEIVLEPEDGLYPLPYMALQANGSPWEGDEATPLGPRERARQPFYPDASRVFEEIDRLFPADDGLGSQLDRLAEYAFYRPAPPGGYMRSGEQPGHDFFPYRPGHLIRQPSRLALARLTNEVQRTIADGTFNGALWLEGSPYVEDTAYWLNLLLDTPLPIAASAAQRPHGALGDDGGRNIVDAVRYLVSRVWADDQGRDSIGVVVVVDQRILSARAAQKMDARPGGYRASEGGETGAVGVISSTGRPIVTSVPRFRHTWTSAVRLSRLPEAVSGVHRVGAGPIERIRVSVREPSGDLSPAAMPVVPILTHGPYIEPDEQIDWARERGLLVQLEQWLAQHPLAGLVVQGSAPFGTTSESAELALRFATFCGYPVVKAGRTGGGVTEATYSPFAIAAGTLSATKARLLLMACLLRFGALPPASDPANPTRSEIQATRRALDAYQAIFESH